MESELSVRDVLTTEYVGVSESDTVLGAVKLMRAERAGCVLVVRGAEPIGIMTEWDVLGLIEDENDPAETTVGERMSTPVMTISPDRSLADAATTMARDAIRHLVVTTEDELLGLLTQRDIIAAAGSFRGATALGTGDQTAGGEPLQPAASLDPTSDHGDSEILPNGGDEYSTQGVCEACGSLADSLWDANGQLLCADCRAV